MFAGIGDSAGESASTSVATEAATLLTTEVIPDKDAATCATVSATMTTPVTAPIFVVTPSPVMTHLKTIFPFSEYTSCTFQCCMQIFSLLNELILFVPQKQSNPHYNQASQLIVPQGVTRAQKGHIIAQFVKSLYVCIKLDARNDILV